MNERLLEMLAQALKQTQEQTARLAELLGETNQFINNQNTDEQ